MHSLYIFSSSTKVPSTIILVYRTYASSLAMNNLFYMCKVRGYNHVGANTLCVVNDDLMLWYFNWVFDLNINEKRFSQNCVYSIVSLSIHTPHTLHIYMWIILVKVHLNRKELETTWFQMCNMENCAISIQLTIRWTIRHQSITLFKLCAKYVEQLDFN